MSPDIHGDGNQGQSPEKRLLPRSDLDFNLMTTDSVWGSPYVNNDLKKRLKRFYIEQGQDGKSKTIEESLWGLLGFFTRDMRLANLSYVYGEVTYCQYYLDLANDFLQADMIEPFLICLSRCASVLELSQSKGGFLRRRMNTFTQEHYQSELEPSKKSLFGSKPKQQ